MGTYKFGLAVKLYICILEVLGSISARRPAIVTEV
jgi:hypothetical protein